MAARKTIADLERELEEQKQLTANAEGARDEMKKEIDSALESVATNAAAVPTEEQLDLAAENQMLKDELAKNKSHTAASESRLMDYLTQMEEDGGNTDGCTTYTPDEYRVASAAQGRIMGREKGTVTKCTIEELRALINSDWSPSMIMEKHGMDEKALQQLVWKLSLAELRDRPVKLNFKRDTFGREG